MGLTSFFVSILYNIFGYLSSGFVYFYVFHNCQTITFGKTHNRLPFEGAGCCLFP